VSKLTDTVASDMQFLSLDMSLSHFFGSAHALATRAAHFASLERPKDLPHTLYFNPVRNV
jgi:hypothetical protein